MCLHVKAFRYVLQAIQDKPIHTLRAKRFKFLVERLQFTTRQNKQFRPAFSPIF